MEAQAKEPSGTTESTGLSPFPKPTPSTKVRLMENHALGLCLLLLPFFSACEKMADISSPQVYSKNGLSFSYPGNWNITEEEIPGGLGEKTKLLNVESPGDAIVIICAFDYTSEQSLLEWARDFSQSMKEEIPFGEVGDAQFSDVSRMGKTGRIKGIKNKVELSFLGETVPHVQEFFSIRNKETSAFIVCQSAEEDLEKTEPAFRQIVGSFQLK